MSELYDMRFGKRTLRENLAQALATGKLLMTNEGKYMLPPEASSDQYLQVKSVCKISCQFLNKFLFQNAYDKNAVPHGCRSCYKVKIVPENLCGLVALRGILENAPYHAKCGVDLFNPYSRDIYAGFLYLDGLESAREACRDMQDRINEHPDLSNHASLTIKRGCSHYEAACGASDRWSFRDEMEALESELKADFQVTLSNPVEYRVRRMKSMVGYRSLIV